MARQPTASLARPLDLIEGGSVERLHDPTFLIHCATVRTHRGDDPGDTAGNEEADAKKSMGH